MYDIYQVFYGYNATHKEIFSNIVVEYIKNSTECNEFIDQTNIIKKDLEDHLDKHPEYKAYFDKELYVYCMGDEKDGLELIDSFYSGKAEESPAIFGSLIKSVNAHDIKNVLELSKIKISEKHKKEFENKFNVLPQSLQDQITKELGLPELGIIVSTS